ncbi:MAG: DUF1343 domain-containing protein [Leptospira sp.]|nr:DUF1343 domain-containing protein [Leptospira sp.]
MKHLKKYKDARTGILTNHTGYDEKNGYHFIYLNRYLQIARVFVPEHGLFAELQDQVSGVGLNYFSETIEFWNLYGDTEESLIPPDEKLLDLDLIVIDIRDVGARYYTFLTTAYYIMAKVSELKKNGQSVPNILVFDAPNPIGKKVEGTPLKEGYSSFVGVEGVLHRHGMSSGELLSFYNENRNLKLNVDVISPGVFHPKKYDEWNWIPPSPNIPSITTCFVYPGQCLLEGTNLSEGRGTTRPFEIFGAPFIDFENQKFLKEMESISDGIFHLRPLRFKPTFHKHSNTICGGYQLHLLKPKKFHSLFFTLHLLKTIKEFYPQDFRFLEGVYEFRSDRPAIELLVGDPVLLGYLEGKKNAKYIQEYLREAEDEWEELIEKFTGRI